MQNNTKKNKQYFKSTIFMQNFRPGQCKIIYDRSKGVHFLLPLSIVE